MSKKAAFLLIGGILLAVILVSVISVWLVQDEELAYVSVTTEGFGDQDVTDYLMAVTPGDSVPEAFSLKYKKYYEHFGKPLIKGNEFIELLGKKAEGKAKILVYINDILTLDIEQAYLGNNSTMKIVYIEE